MSREEFKEIRQRLGFSQAELAALLGYTHKVRISEFERESNPVAVPRLVAMLMRAMDETGWRPKEAAD